MYSILDNTAYWVLKEQEFDENLFYLENVSKIIRNKETDYKKNENLFLSNMIDGLEISYNLLKTQNPIGYGEFLAIEDIRLSFIDDRKLILQNKIFDYLN